MAEVTSLVVLVRSEGISSTNTQLKEFTKTAESAEKRAGSFGEAIKKLGSSYTGSAGAFESIMVKLREQDALLTRMSTASRGAAGGTEALAAAMAMLAASLNLVNVNLQESQRRHVLNNNAMREAHAVARGLSGSLGALWLTYGNFAGMAVGVAIGTSLKGIVTVGKDVEHTLEGIRVRGNETVESVNRIRESVMELGRGVYGPQQVATAFETLILAGLKAEQALSSIGAALNLATVGGVSIEKSATTLVSVGTAIGFTAEGFGRVGDVIAKTAALSMSSVGTLSEAFKSASSVNRLYGVSLEDIGTSLGILSNLGIQGSAAGTALKNMFKELSSESDKVKGTLKDIGLTTNSFKNADGSFKPLINVISTLDSGLKKLSESEQKTAIARLSNERGLRLMTQALGEYNTTTSDGSNALQKFSDNVENSYGFAAKGAVQMALTAKSQVDSMFDSLKTSFAETFTSIQPEVMAFSARMKEVFASKDFKDGLIVLAQAFAKLALAVAENIPLLTKLVLGFVALKAAMAGAAIWEMAAAGIATVTTAIAALTAGTLTLTAAFPPLLILLGTLALAWAAYNLAKGEDPQRQAKDSQAYASGYINGLNKEAEALDKVNAKLKENKTLAQANAEIEKDASRQKMVEIDNKAIKEAEVNLASVTGVFSFNKTKQLADQTAAQNALNKAREAAAKHLKLAEAAEGSLFAKAKENATLAKAQADASRKQEQEAPTAKLSVKTNKAAENDAYRAALTEIKGEIDKADREIASAEASIHSKFKAGLISEFDEIEQISTFKLKKLEENAKRYQDKLNVTPTANNKAMQAAMQNDIDAAQDAIKQARIRKDDQFAEAMHRLEEDSFLNKQKRLALEGRNEEAAVEKNNRLYSAKITAYQNYLDQKLLIDDVLESGDKEAIKRIGLVQQALSSMRSTGESNVQEGAMADAKMQTQALLERLRIAESKASIKVQGGGLLAGVEADKEISKLRRDSIKEMQEAYDIQYKLANLKGANPAEQKKLMLFGEELAKLQKDMGNKDAWSGAQESLRKYGSEASDIGTQIGNAMTNAFKGAEDALTNFIMTGKLDFRSLATSIIADLARIQAKALISSAMGNSGGGLGGMLMGALAGSFGATGIFGANAGVAASQGLSMADIGSAFADGGDPPVGKVSMVGERGPELFVPKQAGTIIPNHVLTGGSSGSVQKQSGNDMNFTIVNQTTGRIDSVKEQRLSDTERALIISEAVNATAQSLYDGNSGMSKGIRNTHNVQRIR